MAKTSPRLHLHRPFFEKRPAAAALIELFDYLPGVIFYAKDRESRYIAANRAMLVAKELGDPEDLLGRTDRDFHPAVMADAYIAEDRRVMELGRSLTNQVWFVVDRSGRPGWFNSSKVPLHDEAGVVIGIAGVRYAIETPEDREKQFRGLAPVIRHLEENYTSSVPMAEMARLAGISSTHFNRQFTFLFGMSPTRFLHSLRVEKARQLLIHTDRAVGEIAIETGYHDQSHFTRHFRRLSGMTPGQFRARFGGKGNA
jgi:AraC-like DNA-binding protein